MAPTIPSIRWTDISAKKTDLPTLIQLLNRRLGRVVASGGGRSLVVLIVDNTPNPIVPGGIVYLPFPKLAAKIDGWTMVADQVGSHSIDVGKAMYPTIPAIPANSITAAAPPILTAQQINRAVSVPSWSADIAEEETLVFKVTASLVVTRVTLCLSILKL